MKNLLAILSLFLIGFDSVSQEISFKIDSVKIFQLPLSLRTSLSLNDYDVRNWKEKVLGKDIVKTDMISDSLKLEELIVTKFSNAQYQFDSENSIDVRIVLDIYLNTGIIYTIQMDSMGYYLLGPFEVPMKRNRNLINWLNNYIPELK